jgi:ribosomal protein L20
MVIVGGRFIGLNPIFQNIILFRISVGDTLKIARERVEKALQYSYRDIRNKKRDMESLWIECINPSTRLDGACLCSTSENE